MKTHADYIAEYDAAIAKAARLNPGHDYQIKRCVYVLGLWEMDHGGFTPGHPEYLAQLEKTANDDPDLYKELEEGIKLAVAAMAGMSDEYLDDLEKLTGR